MANSLNNFDLALKHAKTIPKKQELLTYDFN